MPEHNTNEREDYSWAEIADRRHLCPSSPGYAEPHVVTDGGTCDECGADYVQPPVRYIKGTMVLDGGHEVQFLISYDDDRRWDNTREHLAAAVEPCRLIHTALFDADLWVQE